MHTERLRNVLSLMEAKPWLCSQLGSDPEKERSCPSMQKRKGTHDGYSFKWDPILRGWTAILSKVELLWPLDRIVVWGQWITAVLWKPFTFGRQLNSLLAGWHPVTSSVAFFEWCKAVSAIVKGGGSDGDSMCWILSPLSCRLAACCLSSHPLVKPLSQGQGDSLWVGRLLRILKNSEASWILHLISMPIVGTAAPAYRGGRIGSGSESLIYPSNVWIKKQGG